MQPSLPGQPPACFPILHLPSFMIGPAPLGYLVVVLEGLSHCCITHCYILCSFYLFANTLLFPVALAAVTSQEVFFLSLMVL